MVIKIIKSEPKVDRIAELEDEARRIIRRDLRDQREREQADLEAHFWTPGNEVLLRPSRHRNKQWRLGKSPGSYR